MKHIATSYGEIKIVIEFWR